MSNDTPRTSAALGATLEAGWDLGPQHRALTELCRELERENAMLRQGDTCARQCEGTAYRIEGRTLRHHLTELAKFADSAALVLATLEAENSDEEEQIQQIIDGISTWAPPAMLGAVTANDRVEGRDAASSRRVPSHDGLCGNGSEVGDGGTAVDIAQAPDIHAELTMAAFHWEVGK